MNKPNNALFSADELPDAEVARMLAGASSMPAEHSPPTNVTTLPSSALPPRADRAEMPADQPDLFATLTNYEQLPQEWRNKHLWDWHDETRVIPVDVAISALFTFGNNATKRRAYQRDMVPILSQDFEMRYTGIELRQDDELNWMQLLHMNRGSMQPLGAPIQFEPAPFMKSVGKTVSGANYTTLKESLARLQATTIELYSRKHRTTKTFRFICYFEFEDERHFPLPAWKVVLDPRLFYLLDGRYHGQMNFERRRKLGNGLASKMHSYFCCHKRPMDRPVSDFFMICVGQDEDLAATYVRAKKLKSDPEIERKVAKYLAGRRADFRRDLEEALARLASPEIGFIANWHMYKSQQGKNDVLMLHVDRSDAESLALKQPN